MLPDAPEGLLALPILHYSLEAAAEARIAFQRYRPDCVAVELPEPLQPLFEHASSRLPDLTLIVMPEAHTKYYLVEPCDPAFEALRSSLESGVPRFCIDLDVADYPLIGGPCPDSYAIKRIGLKNYYEAYSNAPKAAKGPLDSQRELYMAMRLKQLMLSYDRVLFICGMEHLQAVLSHLKRSSFPKFTHHQRGGCSLATLTDRAARDSMATCGWLTQLYERWRLDADSQPDRQQWLYELLKEAALHYEREVKESVQNNQMRNVVKFARNYALLKGQLLPDLFQLLAAAKGCVDDTFAYFVWETATAAPFVRNVDNLFSLELTPQEIWGSSKSIRFQLKAPSRKQQRLMERRKERYRQLYQPPNPYALCSYPKEDLIIENFADYLKKKGVQQTQEESSASIPFSTSLEEGIDIKETLRHWHEKTLYVKKRGPVRGETGSVVVIFDEDGGASQQGQERYPWKMTWQGEHKQESDMAFYATDLFADVVGPGISRCEYGGLMMSYPPRRIYDIWSDPDYESCRTKAEVLLMAAIDYALQPLIVYVAATPPRSFFKSFARRYGKKIVYFPIAQLSRPLLCKMRVFHVLDGHDRRAIADEYIL